MSPAKCLVSLMLMLVAAGYVVHAQERIKMCGRDLIRLAVSSCGNSRLRRSMPDVELEQYSSFCKYFMLLIQTSISHISFHLLCSGDQHASTEEHQAIETIPTSAESEDREKEVFPLAPHWYPLSSRIRRNAVKISDICCEKGCSMKELIQFC
ncbi:insulin-like 3 (Leydig cell) [Labrus bergylta]|uniref:insulin-like 3 (Leydig cell) n=1 Tax=Labrus bergylta TaxID=56723 RepID=UPI00331428B3